MSQKEPEMTRIELRYPVQQRIVAIDRTKKAKRDRLQQPQQWTLCDCCDGAKRVENGWLVKMGRITNVQRDDEGVKDKE